MCYKVCQCLAAGQWFSLGTTVSSTSKTDCQDIAEILLKVALNTITLTLFGNGFKKNRNQQKRTSRVKQTYRNMSDLTGRNQSGPTMFSAYLLWSGNNFLFVGLSNIVFKKVNLSCNSMFNSLNKRFL
jgi:hypothetical protein